MAKEKLVTAITSMNEDFAQWYTDVVKKAELIDYSSVRGCMILRPNGYAIFRKILMLDLRQLALKMYICLYSFQKAFYRKKRTMLKVLLQK